MKSNFLRDPIVGFLLKFVLIFGLLIAPWPGWNDFYAGYFRGFGQLAFGASEGKRVVDFSPSKPEQLASGLDTQLTLGNRDLLDSRGKGSLKRVNLDTRSIGWVPTALTAALVLATPIPWRRRAMAFCGGILLVHLFILFSLQTWIWDNATDVSLMALTPPVQRVVSELDYTFITQLGASFSVPVVIWVVVTFRRRDLMASRPGKS